MDETGSTTFVLFDSIVTQFIGKTVQDLIGETDRVILRTTLRPRLDKQLI